MRRGDLFAIEVDHATEGPPGVPFELDSGNVNGGLLRPSLHESAILGAMVKAVAARDVLGVAETAVDMFGELEPMGDRWRVMWSASIALLRSVGHALDKVDAKSEPELRAAIEKAWQSWKTDRDDHDIFWFIEDARNLVVKEGRVSQEGSRGSAGQSVTVRIGGEHQVGYPVYDERFRDLDQIGLLLEAIAWWHVQLDLIEADSSRRSP